MLRFLPPAGAPLKMIQVLRALRAALSRNGLSEESLALLGARLQVRHVLGVSSGRAALWSILSGLRRLRPDRYVVALPAYTCYSVPASVVRAGLKLHPVEVDPETLDFDFSQLEALPNEKLLCIVTSNLFGFPNDVRRIGRIAKAKGAFVVDDAAQALGASRKGRFSGTTGDVGLYSLGRGKAVTAMEGGIIVTQSDEIFGVIRAELSQLPNSSYTHASWLFFQMLAYSVFLNPHLYWIPDSLPFLKLGATEYSPAFPITSMPGLSRALLPELVGGLQEMNRIRRQNASAIAQSLGGNAFFKLPKPGADCRPNYIRFPLLAQSESIRDRAIARLRTAGICASPFYPAAICDIEGIAQHMNARDFHRPQAEELSRRMLTLPTHPFLNREDVGRMAAVLNGICYGSKG